MLFYILFVICVIPCMILLPTVVKGYKHIPRKGRMILVCNHQSNLDAVIISVKLVKRKFNFMAKAEMFKNKFAGTFCKALGMYPVNREKNDIQAVKKTLSLLKNEKALCIFPEGTRTKGSEVTDAKNGAVLFALKTKSPIVPACFVRKPGFFKINTLLIGEAFNLSEMEEFKDKPATKELLERGTEIMTEKMNMLLEDYLSKKNKNKSK